MSEGEIELVRGSDNVFRDFGCVNADVELANAILAAEIIKVLDREKLSVRAGQARTGIAAADFSRIRECEAGAVYGGPVDVHAEPAGGAGGGEDQGKGGGAGGGLGWCRLTRYASPVKLAPAPALA